MRTTPIEEYKGIYVKREDLCVEPNPSRLEMPAQEKLRGVENLLKRLKSEGYKTIGVFDTRVSTAGWGVAALCSELGLKCRCYYPYLKNETRVVPHQQVMASAWGAKLVALPAGRTAILYAQARKDLETIEESYMLPLGLVCIETVLAVAKVAQELPRFGTIVVCTGTGTIAAGILAGLTEKNTPNELFGISCGMNLEKQTKRIKGLLKQVGEEGKMKLLRLGMADKDYYTPETFPSPFPSHPYYDRKAWRWLLLNQGGLVEPILFWNIGA